MMRSLITKAMLIGGLGYAALRLQNDRVLPWESSEKQLIKDARKGDRVAFEGLSSLHEDALKRFLTRRVHASDAEDVYQETVLAAWEHLDNYRGPGRFRTWLFAICVNKIKDYWRRQQRLAPEHMSVELEDQIVYVQEEYAAIDLRETLRELWEAFTPSQQELLELYYGAELTLQEISRVLGRNLSTVKYQFYRAHEVAAERLTPELLEAIGSVESK